MDFKRKYVKSMLAMILASSATIAMADSEYSDSEHSDSEYSDSEYSDSEHSDSEDSDSESLKVLKIEGVLQTGFNELFGEPITNFGPVLGAASFDTLCAYNPSGSDPLPLKDDMPDATLVATCVDPDFLAVFNLPTSIFDPADVNLPLRKVKVNTSFDDKTRETLRGHLEAGQLEPSLALPNGPITLGQWKKAKGDGIIVCHKDGNSTITLKMKGLIPNGLYSVGAAFQTVNPDSPLLLRPALPLGGVPNVFVVDKNGKGFYERELNYCPMDLKPGEDPFLAITIIYRADQQNYGTVPIQFKKGIMPGLHGIGHIHYMITGTDIKTGRVSP